MKSIPSKIASIVTLGLCLSVPGHAQVFNTDGLYSTPSNWSSNSVPNLGAGATGTIAANATYTNSGDLLISNGGVLEVTTGGTWTQTGGNNYIQLQGNGTVLVDGGTFNQGTASSTPFNIGGTGNAFTISSGTANFDRSININSGLTWTQTGGDIFDTGNGELDVNTNTVSMTGGTFTTRLITTVNAAAATPAGLQFGGGTINFTDATGIYGSRLGQINFTLNSFGIINFEATSADAVTAMINSGVIEYNGAVGTVNGFGSNFTVIATGLNSSEVLSGPVPTGPVDPVVVPEPSTYAMLSAGLLTLLVVLRRRAAKQKI